MPQIYNQNILLNFSPAAQSIDLFINCPFNVKRVVFHPPRSNIPVANANNDQYLLYSGLNNGSAVGMVNSTLGDAHNVPITITFQNAKMFNGYYSFWVRSFTQLTGGAPSNLDAIIWQHIEFYDE